LYAAQLEGWATKKYGEEWEDRLDPEQVAEEFDEWAELRELGPNPTFVLRRAK
jgi:hypothetical protein